MWLCKSILKKIKIKKGSKRWTSVPAIKTMGTSMPASRNEKRERERERERIKIVHVFM